MNVKPYLRDAQDGEGLELVIPMVGGNEYVTRLTTQSAWRMVCDLMTWLGRQVRATGHSHGG